MRPSSFFRTNNYPKGKEGKRKEKSQEEIYGDGRRNSRIMNQNGPDSYSLVSVPTVVLEDVAAPAQ